MKLELDIDEELYLKLEERAKQKGSENIESYVVSLLVQIGSKISSSEKSKMNSLSEEQRQRISETYKDLGYE